MTDIKLTQEPKIFVQLVKALEGHEGPLTINLRMGDQIIGNEKPLEDKNDVDSLLGLIDSFPPSRLRNLINHIYYLSRGKFGGNKVLMAEWLGINKRTLYRQEQKIPLVE